MERNLSGNGLDQGDGAEGLLFAESHSPLAQKRLAWNWASLRSRVRHNPAIQAILKGEAE
jgi:hypothetical protein